MTKQILLSRQILQLMRMGLKIENIKVKTIDKKIHRYCNLFGKARSTTMTKICVVGAGIIGSTTAFKVEHSSAFVKPFYTLKVIK